MASDLELLPSAFIFFFSLVIYFFLKSKLQVKTPTKNHPPGPRSLPIVGNLHQLGALPHHTLRQLSEKYGPVMLIKLGNVPTVIISSSEAAKDLIKNNDLNSCSRPRLTGPGKLSYDYLDVAFTSYGDYWRDIRKLCVTELLNAKRVQSFRVIREEEVSLLIDSLSNSSSGEPVHIGEKIMALNANVTCRAAFGKSFQERAFAHERFQEVVREGFILLGNFSATDYFPFIGRIIDRITGQHARLERNFRELDAFYQKVIDDHTQKGEKDEQEQQDVVDVLLELEKSQTKDPDAFQFNKDHIKAILMNIFLGGVDTSAVTMVWAMTELVRNPRVMKKAQEEIRTCIGNKGKVSEDDIKQLGYLEMILKETMRLHPPAPLLIPRETISQFTINGYEIYPKSRVHINVWAIGRDPKIWKNPEEFFPERFMGNPIDYKGMNYELLPFGGGRRGCPGVSMAMTNVELALANLLYSFDWNLPYNMKVEDINMEEAFGLTTYKKVPLLLVPSKYQPSIN